MDRKALTWFNIFYFITLKLLFITHDFYFTFSLFHFLLLIFRLPSIKVAHFQCGKCSETLKEIHPAKCLQTGRSHNVSCEKSPNTTMNYTWSPTVVTPNSISVVLSRSSNIVNWTRCSANDFEYFDATVPGMPAAKKKRCHFKTESSDASSQ